MDPNALFEGEIEEEAQSNFWFPLTPGKLAVLAAERPGRLAGVTLLCGLLAAAVLWNTLAGCWFPILEAACRALPERGAAIRDGRLFWPNPERRALAANEYLALIVDPEADWPRGEEADLTVSLLRSGLGATWILGDAKQPYPAGLRLDLTRAAVLPVWEAWRPHVKFFLFLGLWFGWLAFAGVQAALLLPPLRLLARLFSARPPLGTTAIAAFGAQAAGACILALLAYLYGFRVFGLLEFAGGAGVIFLGNLCLATATALRLPEAAPNKPLSSPHNPFISLEE